MRSYFCFCRMHEGYPGVAMLWTAAPSIRTLPKSLSLTASLLYLHGKGLWKH